jgi:hypothetical protein
VPESSEFCPHCGNPDSSFEGDGEESDSADLAFTSLDDERYEDFLEQEGLVTKPDSATRKRSRRCRLLAGALIVLLVLGLLVLLMRL